MQPAETQPARSSHRVGRIIRGAAAPLVIVAAVAGCSSSGSKLSDEDQIRHLVAEFTRAFNATDAQAVNAMSCAEVRTTAEDLTEQSDEFGTLSTSVESVEITGDVATMRISRQGSTETDSHQRTWYSLREDGTWKLCDEKSVQNYRD